MFSVGMIVAYCGRVNFSVALVLPEVKRLYQLTDTDRGLLTSVFFWPYALLQIPAGWIVDRKGSKVPYGISFALWSGVSIATAFATALPHLIAARFLLGVSESVIMPASMRWIRFHFAEKQRGLAVGLYMTGTKLGPAIGMPLAAIMTKTYGWRTLFIALGVFAALWLVPWFALLRRDPQPAPVAAQKTEPAFSFDKIFSNRVIWGTFIGTFCYMYFVYYCMTWMPAYFVEHRHLSLNSMGWYTFMSFGGMAIVATLAGWAADRLIARGGDPVKVRKGFILAGFVLASTEMAGFYSDSVPVAVFFAVFSLSGLGLVTANCWALTQTLIPGSAIGRIVGIQNCAANLPGVVAPILTGWLMQKTGSYRAPMQAIWVFLIAGIATYVFLVRREKPAGA